MKALKGAFFDDFFKGGANWDDRRMKKTYLYTFLGITLNAIENSMTIVTNLGSILWSASIVNMMHAFG